MGIRIKEVIKNQTGGSLALVLIIGMIIMIMVASLLAVANSDFTFTQETVESRQAYIDAKSVIEYGKIEINERMKTLDAKNQELKNLYEELATLTERGAIADKETEINNKIAEINRYVDGDLSAPYYIGGVENNSAKTPTETSDQTSAVGVLSVTKVSLPNNPGVTTFTFDIKTQNLRRKLDYKADFNSSLTSTTTVTTGEPGNIPERSSGDWYPTWILTNNGNKPVQCVITHGGGGGRVDYFDNGTTLSVPEDTKNLEIGKDNGEAKFGWKDGKRFVLTARNIDVVVPLPQTGVTGAQFNMTAAGDSNKTGQIFFEQGYRQVNGDKNTLTAGDIIIRGDLVIDENSYLEINCTNLWVTGDIRIETSQSKPASFLNRITATNIFVGEKSSNKNVRCINPSKVVWSDANFWLNGTKTTAYANSGSSSGGSVAIKPNLTELVSEKYY